MRAHPCGRREFLLGLAAFATHLATPRSGTGATEAWRPERSPFTLGIASGSPTSDGFVLWTRLMGENPPKGHAVLVDWEVFEPDDPARILARGQTPAPPELAHSVHAEVAGLAADRWYGYRFRLGEWVSAIGKTRTLPKAGTPARMRFAYASCQHWEHGFYAGYRHMRDDNPDLVLFVGDYIYEYASSTSEFAVRHHRLPVARTLEDYRAHYAIYKSDPWLQAMHAHCPWLVIWDDHEVENDYAGLSSLYSTEHFTNLRAAAYQAYYEHMPLRPSTMLAGVEGLLSGKELRIYDRVEYGGLATFHLLDCRQYRNPAAGESRDMLGKPQERWLDEGIGQCARQGVHWNVVVQQNRVSPANYPSGAGKNASADRWDSYHQSRLRLIGSLVRHKPRNTLIIGGDIHQNWVARLHQDPYDIRSPVVASEFVGTSITSRMGRSQKEAERHAAQNPQCLLVNTEKRGYGMVELTPERAEVALRVLEDPRREDSGIATLARFVVEDGKPVRFADHESIRIRI
ncbi:MAG: alkaline phosphatase D family protein [Magnetococcales bacterium]|nr:alkaline phosphatase D family protein [Magnetococcales bacterium]